MPSNSVTQRIPASLLYSVALISAAVLGFEVALTRVFAVLLRYHFAFLAISIALCGLGVGGYLADWLRRYFKLSLPLLALLFAVSIDGSLLLILRVVFAFFPQTYWLAAVIVLVPFTFAGIILAEIFSRYPSWSGRLYAWDLGGAAITAIYIVLLMQAVGGIDACLIVAACAAASGCLLAAIEGENAKMWLVPSEVMVVLLLAVSAVNHLAYTHSGKAVWDVPGLAPQRDTTGTMPVDENGWVTDDYSNQPLFLELGLPGHTSKIIDSRWNAFARTDVVKDTTAPGTYLIYTNGNVPTNMMRWNGDLDNTNQLGPIFPLSDWCFSIAPIGASDRPAGSVLSIGPGGGLDALLALHHGAADFDGAEINPSIVGIMHDYRKWNGGIYERKDVHVVTAEGRSFVRDSIVRGRRYNLVFSALTKTATAGQGAALLESFIHTQEAFTDYLKVLDKQGQVTFVVDQPLLIARFFVTACKALEAQGLTDAEACRHIAMIYDPEQGGSNPYTYGIVVQKEPFTKEQTYQMVDGASARNLEPIFIPSGDPKADHPWRISNDPQAPIGLFKDGQHQVLTVPYSQVAEGKLTADQFTELFRKDCDPPRDISGQTDDSPFTLDLNISVEPMFKGLAQLAACLAVALALISWPSFRKGQASVAPLGAADPLYVLYFLALGVGFMLVEIPLTEKLILPLGYPTLALTVILFSILLGGGAGSLFSQRFANGSLRNWAAISAVAVAAAAALGSVLLDHVGGSLLLVSLPMRCLLVALMLLPLGFLLGAPFPSGLRLFAQRRPEHVPLTWGLNGVASVVGSLCAAMWAKMWGFHDVLLIGSGIYVLAALLLVAAAASLPEPVVTEPDPVEVNPAENLTSPIGES